MTQDFASTRRKSGSATKKPRPPARSKPPVAASTWFGAGVATGIFICALAWLANQQPDPAVNADGTLAADSTPADASEKGPRFDFYTLLPEQRVEVPVNQAEVAAAQAPRANDQYLLQAGSFKQAKDADRRRAELILLGLDAHVEDTSGDNGRWFRVYIGPFDSRSLLAKARSLTAQQGIDTLLLKRPKPNQG